MHRCDNETISVSFTGRQFEVVTRKILFKKTRNAGGTSCLCYDFARQKLWCRWIKTAVKRLRTSAHLRMPKVPRWVYAGWGRESGMDFGEDIFLFSAMYWGTRPPDNRYALSRQFWWVSTIILFSKISACSGISGFPKVPSQVITWTSNDLCPFLAIIEARANEKRDVLFYASLDGSKS